MEKHEILETIGISEYARHLCYIPDLNNGKGGFETGDWETSIYVNRNGAKIGDGPTYAGSAGTAYYDGHLYSFEQGGSTSYSLYVYDYKTGVKTDSIDLSQYVELSNITTAVAGGLSTYTTASGHTYLLACIQNSEHASQMAIFDLSGVIGVAGYNVYCNGQQVNTELLPTRSFTETRSEEGVYNYQVQTVYIDGTTSDLSTAVSVEVVPAGECKVPTDLKAVASTFGYNVLLSFADPDLTTETASFEGFEAQTAGQPVSLAGATNVTNAWKVTTALAYQGEKAIVADTTTAPARSTCSTP
jgi:hypothetical protein